FGRGHTTTVTTRGYVSEATEDDHDDRYGTDDKENNINNIRKDTTCPKEVRFLTIACTVSTFSKTLGWVTGCGHYVNWLQNRHSCTDTKRKHWYKQEAL